MFKYIVRSMGLRYLPMSVSSVLIGSACANFQGYFDELKASACLLFAMAAQITANLTHRYYDLRYDYTNYDTHLATVDKASGFSPDKIMRECVIGAFIFASLLGFSIMSYTGLWAFFAGFAIALYVFFFNSGPFPLSRKGFGEFTAFLFYGPVGVILTYMVQAPVWEWRSMESTVIISIAIGLLAAAVVLAHYFWTCDDDRTLQKDNLPSKYGKKNAGNVFLILGICACALLIFVSRKLPWWASCAPAAALAGHITVWYKMRRLPQDKLQQAETWEMLILFALALAIFICCCFTGIDERIDTMYFPE